METDMTKGYASIIGTLRAGVLAAPLTMIGYVLANAYATLPAPVVVTTDALGKGLASLLWLLVFGGIVGIPICVAGSFIMEMLARHFAWARPGLSWLAAGAAVGSVPFWFGPETFLMPLAFGFTFASTICGWLCRVRGEPAAVDPPRYRGPWEAA